MRIRSVPAKCSEINAIGEKIMKQHRKCKAILSTALAGSLLFSALTMTPMQTADAASACTVNTNKTYQLIKGFGGINLPEWQAINLPQGKSADMTAKQVQKAFGNGDDELGLSILRMYIPMGIPVDIYDIFPYLFTIIVLIITSIRQNKEHNMPKHCGFNYFREER